MASKAFLKGSSEDTVNLNELTPEKAEDVKFILFTPVPSDGNLEALNKWMESTWYIEDDLHHLLSKPAQQFWCQVIFSDSLEKCIASFLKHVPRFDFPLNENKYSKEVEGRLNSLGRLFFLTCLRMATYKNDSHHIIPRSEFADIIYENFLFDIPKLLDFCAIYADNNRSQVEKAVSGIFEAQPKYLLDLKSVADFFPTILDSVCECFDLTDDGNVTRKISPSKGHASTKAKSKDAKMLELISFTYDTFNSLRVLFEVYECTAEPFFSVLSQITEFYEAFCDRLCADLSKLKDLPEKLSDAFCLTRHSMLQVFRQVFYQSTLKRIFDIHENREEIVERYLSTLQTALSNGRFVADYFHYFPIQEDVELIEQIGVEFDEMRLHLIRDSITQLTQMHSPEQNWMPNDITTDDHLANGDNIGNGEACLGAAGGADWSSLCDGELQKISSILELLPHLEMGFVKRCLDFYEGDAETVISVVLEDNLPPFLTNDDQGSEFGSGDVECLAGPSGEIKENSVLSKRRNIYDGDEFDVFSHDINVSRVHIGKKTQELKLPGLDKSLKSKVKKYSRNVDDDDDALYQDEYDDTYDDHVLGEVDVDDIDELLERDASVAKPRNRPLKREESEEEEEDVADSRPVKNPQLFHEDPALLRERAAQNQAIKNASRGNPYRKNRRNKNDSDSDDDDMFFPRNNNAPRGRARFNHANHNRKDMAARKHRF